MPRQPTQQESLDRKANDDMVRQGFKWVCNLKNGTSYWRHRKQPDNIMMLYRDEKGKLKRARL